MIKFILSLLFLTVQTLAITDAERAQLGIGNINYLTNPGFESGRGGWSASGGTFSTVASSSVQYGKGSVSWDSNAASQTLTSSQVIPLDSNNGLKGQSGLFSCFIKVTSGTATHKLQVYVGTTLFEQSIVSSTDGARTNLYFPISTASSQNLQLAGIISVASNEPEIIVDDCFLGLASGAGSGIGQFSAISEWIDWTPTGSWTTNTAYSGKYRFVGSNVELQFKLTVSGAVTAASLTVNFPTGIVLDTTKFITINQDTYFGRCLARDNATASFLVYGGYNSNNTSTALFVEGVPSAPAGLRAQSTVSNTSPMTWASGDSLDCFLSFPVQGRSASQSAAAANQTDIGETSYTPTFTGFGTVSSVNCRYTRKAEKLKVKCRWVNGTTTGVEARISFPSGLTSRSTVGSPENCGTTAPNQTGAAMYHTLCEPSVGYFTFSANGGAAAGLTKLLGTTFTSSVAMSFEGEVSIEGWAENQRAPTLIGSVTSNSVGALRIEGAQVSSAGVVSNESSDWISSNCAVTDTSLYTCTFTTAFSSRPNCQVTPSGADTGYVFLTIVDANSNASQLQYRTANASTTKTAFGASIECKGPR